MKATLIAAATALVALALAGSARAMPDAASPPDESLPSASVYQLPMHLTDQDGRPLSLGSLRGQPVLVTMFYASCQNVCSTLAFHMHRIERALPAAERDRLRVLMVSFDPERDTPQALHHFAELHQADPTRWVIARADDGEVRDLAAVLGLRYRRLEGGVYSHSSVITLLDADGTIRARTQRPAARRSGLRGRGCGGGAMNAHRWLLIAFAAVWLRPAMAAETAGMERALAGTRPILDLRLRYEDVTQDGLPADATAVTLRGRVGFETGAAPFRLLAEGELVRALDSAYNSTLNGKTQYPVVADPRMDEINRLQLTSTVIPATTVILGRQRILYDDHRFVGNVGWRQNEQTYDALRIVQHSIAHLTIDAAWLNRVNRVFGPDSPAGHYTGDSYVADIAYESRAGKVVGVAQLLDLREAPMDSSATYGLRYTTERTLAHVKLAGLLSYATQRDRAGNPLHYRDDYLAGELKATLAPFSLGAGLELLQGDGVKGFTTPLATLHRFQGWADKFLATPPDGIDDRYLDFGYAKKPAAGPGSISASASYHWLRAERGSAHYGTELDALLQVGWRKCVAALKYADYRAESFASDTRKLWLQVEFSY